jgi:hypothetical protein
MAITSQLRPAPTVGEVAVLRWQEAGLLKPSIIKPLVTTIETNLVLSQLGTFTPKTKTACARSSLPSSADGSGRAHAIARLAWKSTWVRADRILQYNHNGADGGRRPSRGESERLGLLALVAEEALGAGGVTNRSACPRPAFPVQ